ncbi:MAG: ATP-binding cassette domain-containing protein [Haloarculaceae archaeon]
MSDGGPAGDAADPADRRASADAPLVDVRSITVGYGEAPVLTDVSLSVERGEFVGLVGPNGAGKTTLVKAINGVLAPREGRVLVDGADVNELSSRAASRRVATVPQDTTVAFDFAVADVVEMGRTPYTGRFGRDAGATEAVERALERTATARFRDRSVRSLSGGERQRVVLARALAQETPALVLDEPTASLDINHQARTLALVRELAREGKGALAAIHDLDLAARFCDRLVVLADGGVQAVGPPREVLTGERVRAVFDTAAAVVPSPVTGAPTVTPLFDGDDGTFDRRVHVAGAGDVAGRTVAALSAAGATVTAGAFPEGGLAASVAREHGVDPVVASPFAPVDAATEAAARDHLASADVAVLAGTVPPSVHALVRDHDVVVRVPGDGTPSGPPGDAPDAGSRADATTSVASVVEAVRRVAGERVSADDRP